MTESTNIIPSWPLEAELKKFELFYRDCKLNVESPLQSVFSEFGGVEDSVKLDPENETKLQFVLVPSDKEVLNFLASNNFQEEFLFSIIIFKKDYPDLLVSKLSKICKTVDLETFDLCSFASEMNLKLPCLSACFDPFGSSEFREAMSRLFLEGLMLSISKDLEYSQNILEKKSVTEKLQKRPSDKNYGTYIGKNIITGYKRKVVKEIETTYHIFGFWIWKACKYIDRQLLELVHLFNFRNERKLLAEKNQLISKEVLSSSPTAEKSVTDQSCENKAHGSEFLLWSDQEQKLLEEALKSLKPRSDVLKVTDLWTAVARHVGTRSPKECATRYLQLRNLLHAKKTKARETSSEIHNINGNSNDKKLIAQQTSRNESFECSSEISRSSGNSKVFLHNLFLEAIDYITVHVFRAVASCDICRKETDIQVVFGMEEHFQDPAGSGKQCDKCQKNLRVVVIPKIVTPFTHPYLCANYSTNGCTILYIVNLEFLVRCGSCEATLVCRDYKIGLEKKLTCASCFNKMSLSYTSYYGSSDDDKTVSLNKQPEETFEAKSKLLKKKVVGNVLKPGDHLHNDGACKHYRQSYRWFRFPCCSKLFPCDVCHDAASDHPYEWANRMVCGFCSREQKVLKACAFCSHSITRESSSHWEGGKGCRDFSKMSNKDKHKSRLLGKLLHDIHNKS